MKSMIRVQNLSKQFRINAREERLVPYDTLRESMVKAVRNSFARIKGNGHSDTEILWALKDINFEVNPGEVMGIIGPNGAGKSTLLKILSRVIEPTTGRAELYGKVGSLLDIGTGFHPDLTGRENVYLNGAVLGMSRREINAKFDEIIDFAGTEKFLETAIKHYSSGMYVRLAFAVAAHLNPEILVVDEVLAVGDMAFQKKCLGKMNEVSQGGRTVLFVSHNMVAVENLCHRGIVLGQGKLTFNGSAKEAINFYLNSVTGESSQGHVIDLENAVRANLLRPRVLQKMEFYTDD